MTLSLDRLGDCPQCGASIHFRFASANAKVCEHCRFVVVRQDRDLRAIGRAADLVPLASPFQVGRSGTVDNRRFRIGGRVQYDREGQASAPWQEQYIEWEDGSWAWLAQAQGRAYLTSLHQERVELPDYEQATPGTPVSIGQRTLYVAERSLRRTLSAEGELPFPVQPEQIERYADLSGPDGSFGTIDYGDGSAAPQLYLGRQIDVSAVHLDGDSAAPAPRVETRTLECPGCGGNLPLVSPEAERIVCRYCHLSSDITAHGLVGRTKPSYIGYHRWPQIPIGSRGNWQGLDIICIAYLIRSTVVDSIRYRWREYLLYAEGEGYLWLLEEDEKWQLSRPIAPGDVGVASSKDVSTARAPDTLPRTYRGETYLHQQTVRANVDYVVGEMYWKVEVGETVIATEWKHGQKRLSQERTDDEVVMSHAIEITRSEIQAAFSSTSLQGPLSRKKFNATIWPIVASALFVGWLAILLGADKFQANRQIYGTSFISRQRVEMPDAFVMVNKKICMEWRRLAALGKASVPLGCMSVDHLDKAFYTQPFVVDADKKNLRIDVFSRPNNSWVYVEAALIDDKHGHVYERGFELEFYHGVEDGVPWREGKYLETIWLNRIPKGRYLLRLDPQWEPGRAPTMLSCNIYSDSPRSSYAHRAFWALVLIVGGCFIVDYKWQTRAGGHMS